MPCEDEDQPGRCYLLPGVDLPHGTRPILASTKPTHERATWTIVSQTLLAKSGTDQSASADQASAFVDAHRISAFALGLAPRGQVRALFPWDGPDAYTSHRRLSPRPAMISTWLECGLAEHRHVRAVWA